MAHTFDGLASTTMLAEMHRLFMPVTAMSTGTAPTPLLRAVGIAGGTSVRKSRKSCGWRARRADSRGGGKSCCCAGGRSSAPFGSIMANAVVIVVHSIVSESWLPRTSSPGFRYFTP